MTNFADRFGDIVRGLLSLEINTILKEGMSATRMGPPQEALDEIAACYAAWLGEHGSGCTSPPEPATASYFKDTLAAQAAKVMATDKSAGTSVIAMRIQRSSMALSSIFDKLVGPNPGPNELVQLRKVWEIGTEEVILQTVLWIDGDATQRIHPAYADKAYEQLLNLHAASVNASLNYWKSLGDMVVSFFRSAWDQLTAK
jgi:hypothetical protein